MSGWRAHVRKDPLPWLLKPDDDQPGVRYLALRDMVGRRESDPEVKQAKAANMASGPVAAILAAQSPEGWWVQPDKSYWPKYTGTHWQVIFLAQLGADGNDPRVRAACSHSLSAATAVHGGLTVFGTPSVFIHCLAGNLEAAFIDLGLLEHSRVQAALDWHARAITGDGIAGLDAKDQPARYYKSSTPGPGFLCAANGGLPCAWGAVKAMLALGRVPQERRTPAIKAAIATGAEFLLGRDPAVADYPTAGGAKPNSSWSKFGYPIGYVTDVLQDLEALALLGHARDPRLANALALVESKQDAAGRWPMEYTYNGKTWADVETKGRPSKWVTLRALRVLKAAYGD